MFNILNRLFKGPAGVSADAAPPAPPPPPPQPSLITPALLTSLGVVAAEKWAGPLSWALLDGGITTRRPIAMFTANAVHESQGFKALEENLNYSSEALLRQWPSHFTPKQAAAYGRAPGHGADTLMVACLAYGGRMGNDPWPSHDGFDYRGAGLFQLTGKSNHALCAKALGVPLEQFPDYIRTPIGACRSAVWFWNSRGLTPLAEQDRLTDVRKAINGGTIGLESVRAFYNTALKGL